MYQAIAKERVSVRDGYLERVLLRLNEITREEADSIAERRREHLETELNQARAGERSRGMTDSLQGVWNGYRGGAELPEDDLDTGAQPREASPVFWNAGRSCPKASTCIRKLTKFVENPPGDGQGRAAARLVHGRGGRDGKPGRSGSTPCGCAARTRARSAPSAIGTPSCRLHDSEMGSRYIPLEHVRHDGQARFEVIKQSPLGVRRAGLQNTRL